jgi:Leucine-rich repeat (LRR) protein
MYNNYLFGQGFIFYTFVFMSIRSVIFVFSLMAFCKVFSQSVQWEEALKQDPKKVLSLDCSGQKWDSLPLEIFLFTNLKELDLSKNKLSQLPEKFNSFQAIEKLDLGRNKFENFPLVICQFPHLKTLHLDRNQITLLPEQIADLQALEYLDLYANGIEQFGEGIFLLPALKVLNIEGVMYGTVFAKQFMARLPQTKVLIDPPCKCLD